MLNITDEELFILEKEPIGTQVTLVAEFSRYIFESDNDSFCITQFVTNNYDNFNVVGNIPFTLEGRRSYELTGEIAEHTDKFTGLAERQLDLRKIEAKKPSTEVEIIKFLSTFTGALVASVLYDEFGDKVLETLMNNPRKVSEKSDRLTLDEFMQLSVDINGALGEASEAFPFLQSYRFTANEVQEMVSRYGEEIKGMVEDNPYILMNHHGGFPGASFLRCDKIAKDIEFDLRAPQRIKGSVEHVLIREGNFGHVYFYHDKIIAEALGILNKDNPTVVVGDEVDTIIHEMIGEGRLHFDRKHNRIYLRRYYEHESELAFNLVSLLEEKEWVGRDQREEVLNVYLETKGIELEDKQRQAVLDLTYSKGGVGVINGGAGTGKTFTVKILMDFMTIIYQLMYKRLPYIQLMAPTGKAAKVMQSATGKRASTIHRGLLWTPDGFQHNEANRLPGDIIVVDESSMLDTSLAYHLTCAVRPGSKLIFLGDPNQLPSIGAGNVLHDIVNSEVFDTVTLDVTRRQSEESQVAINGRLIADMQLPEQDTDKENPKAMIKTKSTPKELLEQSMLGLEYLMNQGVSIDDIQVITPGRKGFTGVHNLNKRIQDKVNPYSNSMEILNTRFSINGATEELNFRIGDRVIHTVNTDELTWVTLDDGGEYRNVSTGDSGKNELITNGEIGRIVDIFQETYITQSRRKQKRSIIVVMYEDGLLKYQGDDKRYLDHAFAMTIHKSQGSQWHSVIQLISTEHFIMLDNSLLYTGYTRAEENQILLTQPRALDISIKTRKAFDRRTTLPEFIKSEAKFT